MSLVNALNYLDHEPILSNKKEIKDSEIIILPGVGSFGRAMNNLKKLDLIVFIYKHIKEGKKLKVSDGWSILSRIIKMIKYL